MYHLQPIELTGLGLRQLRWFELLSFIVFFLDIDWYFYFLTLIGATWIKDKESGKQYTDLKTTVYSYEEARELCLALGGKLPEPRGYNENLFLDSMGTISFFLGLTKTTGNWIWDSDGTQVTWTIWNPVKYNHQCAYMSRNTVQERKDQKRWTSVECSGNNVSRTTVCERK